VTYRHAIVWLDHRQATIIEFSAEHSQETTVTSEAEIGKVHLKSGIPGSGKLADDHRFFDAIIAAIPAPEVLVVGPGNFKTSFEKYVREHHPDFARRVTGVETMDHPTNRQLLAHARSYFQRLDRLNGDAGAAVR
jgi:stalled ribosome rescue protein Dom34